MPYDAAYKEFFHHPEMVKSLLRHFLPPDLFRNLDSARLERLPGDYSTGDFRERFSDVVWKLSWPDGDPLCVALLLEFQSSQDGWMALRMLVYVSLLLADLVRTGHAVKGGKLPAVLPIVIYNGKGRWNGPLEVSELFVDMPGQLRKYNPSQCFFLLDESRIAKGSLGRGSGLFAQVIRFNRISSPEELSDYAKDLGEILGDPRLQDLKDSFIEYFRRFAEKKMPGAGAKLEKSNLQEVLTVWQDIVSNSRQEGVKLGRAEGLLLGRAEGMQLGRAEGMQLGKAEGMQLGRAEALRDTLMQYLQIRFGSFPVPTAQAISRIEDAEKLERLVRSAYRSNTLEEFEEMLGNIS